MSRGTLSLRRSGLIGVLALCMCGLCLGHTLPYLFVSPPPLPSPQQRTPLSPIAKTAARSSQPAPTPTPTETSLPAQTPMPSSTSVTLTLLYDNHPFDVQLKTAWGFACLVETGEATVLFDTGGDGPTLMANMAALGIDPRRIDAVVVSHIHGDHTGGLDALLDANNGLDVYLPHSFPPEFKTQLVGRSRVVEVREPIAVADHVRTTGEMGAAIIEQSLVVETDKGLVVLTGCAHPGVVEIVRRAEVYGEVYLVMGGFHLKDKSAGEIGAVITELKRLGVQKIAPCHCTGEQAIRLFEAAFGPDFIRAGAGLRLLIQK